MIGPHILVYAALYGGLVSMGLFVVLMVVMQVLDLRRLIKDDISRQRKVRAFCRNIHRSIYYATDWDFFVAAMWRVGLLGVISGVFFTIFAVGFYEVFLA